MNKSSVHGAKPLYIFMDISSIADFNVLAVESWLLRPLIERLKRIMKANEKILSKTFALSNNSIHELEESSRKLGHSVQESNLIVRKLNNIFDFYTNDKYNKDNFHYHWLKFIINRFSIELLMTFEDLKTAFDILEHEKSKEFYDYTLFFKINEVLNDLNKNKITTTAMAWCQENHLYLKKNSSTIEFFLQLREILDKIFKNRTMDGLNFLRSKLSSLEHDYSIEFAAKIKSSMLIFAIKNGYPFNRSKVTIYLFISCRSFSMKMQYGMNYQCNSRKNHLNACLLKKIRYYCL